MTNHSDDDGAIDLSRRSFVRLSAVTALSAALPIRRVAAASGVTGATLAQAGATDATDLHFLVIGDWGQRGSATQRSVADAMALTANAAQPRFIISTGDNFYPRGVTGTDDSAWQTSFENVYAAPSLQCRWYAVLGNHDYSGAADAQIAYGRVHHRWTMPQRYYSRTEIIGANQTAEFFFLDTPPIASRNPKFWTRWVDHADPDKQLAWFEDALSRSKADWKIVTGHHPVLSAGPHKPDDQIVKAVKPLFDRYRVDAYFCGHEHNLQHHTSNATHYFVCGAGASTNAVNETCAADFCASRLGFISATLNDRKLHITFIGSNGATLHSADITRT